jgi:diguanylate cyclase (GGDEF)-like protein
MKKSNLLTDNAFISNKDFRTETISINIYRGKLLAAVIILLELVLSFTDIITSMLEIDNRFHYGAYLSMYIAMIIANIVFLLWAGSIKNLNDKSPVQLKRIEAGIVVFIAFIMCWGSIVTLMDQLLYGQIASYIINVMICSVIYYLTLRQIAVPLILSGLIVLVGLPFFQTSSDILVGHYANLGIFLVISFVASRIVFKSHCNQYLSKLLLNQSKEQLEAETRLNVETNEKLKEMNEQLKKLSFLDELTRLPNRRSFRDYVDYHLEYLKENPKLFSVIMIDVDHFKQLNDQYGHNSGDAILKSIAKQITASTNTQKDFVARWGGDEFIFASFSKNGDETLLTADQIRKKILALNNQSLAAHKLPVITVSMGACTLPLSGKETISHCIDCADQALYAAKTSGRNCVRYYNN